MPSPENHTYTPPTVLQFTHDQKRGYPLNLLKANALICLALMCLLGGQLLFNRVETDKDKSCSDLIRVGPRHGMKILAPGKPSDVGVARINPPSMVVVSDNASLDLPPVLTAIDAYDPGADFAGAGAAAGSRGIGLTSDDDLGLPSEETFFDMHIPGKRFPDIRYIANTATGQILRDRGITINKSDVRNHTPRFPVRALKNRIDSAVVKLAVTIDEKGNIKKLKLLEEDPKGYGFAEALQRLDVINRWRITAPCENGRVFGCTFPLTYVFCRDCPVEVHVETPAFALTTSPSPR